MICILRDARKVITEAASVDVQQLAESIETEAMAALHGGVTIIPSELFGDIDILQNVIIDMSNGADDLWFSVGKYIKVNIFYTSLGWQFVIYPVKNGTIEEHNLIEKGKL